ncbi:MAG: exodeoxyribonuclease VII small subunit [Bacillota bacterium]
MTEKKKTTEDMSFEELMERLETVVQALEGGELALEEAVKKYEEGITLSKACQTKLESAEKALTKKMTADGEKPFELGEQEKPDEE